MFVPLAFAAVLTTMLTGCDTRSKSAQPSNVRARAGAHSASAGGHRSTEPPASPQAGGTSSGARGPVVPRHAGELVELDVDGFRPATVSIPDAVHAGEPVVVALHGNFDRPEWQCEVWSQIVRRRAFVLCPRGAPRQDGPDRWTYANLARVREETEAGLISLKRRFGSDLGETLVLAGFSLGAIYAEHWLAADPDRFTASVLVEGGYKRWTLARVRGFTENCGGPVLAACGQTVCRNALTAAQSHFDRFGGWFRLLYEDGAGHTYDGRIAAAVGSAWPGLVRAALDHRCETGSERP